MINLVMRSRDWYLKEVVHHLQNSRINSYEILGPDHKVAWQGVPKKYWPKADIWLESRKKIVIVEIDNDSDPVRSLVKYWPFFQEHFQNEGAKDILFLEVCKFGGTVGKGYQELFRFVSEKFEAIYPHRFHSIFKERIQDDSMRTTRWIMTKLKEIQELYQHSRARSIQTCQTSY